jgi:hypothetical protein
MHSAKRRRCRPGLEVLEARWLLSGIGKTLFASLSPAVEPFEALTSVTDNLGVNIHFTDPQPGEMAMLAAGGFRWVRMDFFWHNTERQVGQYV